MQSYFDENNCYIRSECIIERVLQKIQFPRLCQRVTLDELLLTNVNVETRFIAQVSGKNFNKCFNALFSEL